MPIATTFAALQEEFLTRLPLRIEQLGQQLLAAEKDPLDTTILDEVLRGFHSLAGIGETYGFSSPTARGVPNSLASLSWASVAQSGSARSASSEMTSSS